MSNLPIFLLALLVLAAWTVMLLAVVVIIISRGALEKARPKDVPDVLLGLAALVKSILWLEQLGHLVKGPFRRIAESEEVMVLPSASDQASVSPDESEMTVCDEESDTS